MYSPSSSPFFASSCGNLTTTLVSMQSTYTIPCARQTVLHLSSGPLWDVITLGSVIMQNLMKQAKVSYATVRHSSASEHMWHWKEPLIVLRQACVKPWQSHPSARAQFSPSTQTPFPRAPIQPFKFPTDADSLPEAKPARSRQQDQGVWDACTCIQAT